MSDPALLENKQNKAATLWLVLYLLLVLAVLGVGISVRTMGAAQRSFAATFDKDTIIYDRFGNQLAEFHPKNNMVPVTLEEMSPILLDAVLVTLDPQYLNQRKVEPWALFTAVWRPTGPSRQPTITQRLVRSINGRATTRLAALREASVVIHLEQTEPREALLEQFLSQVSLGRSTYGVEAASRAWYGGSASDLEIGQAAHLAGLMLEGGGEASSERGRNQILARLYEAGLITQKELVLQRTIPLKNLLIPVGEETPVNSLVPDAGLVPYLERIYSQLVEQYGSGPVAKGQIEVDSTLDLGAQKIVATIVQKAAADRGLSEVVVVVLDDRSHVRVMYATDNFVAEEARIDSEEVLKPFRRWESFKRSLNWSNQITALELAQGHALVARDGLRYKTQTLLEIRGADGTRIDRGNDQTKVSLDAQTASQITELLTEFVASGVGFGAQLDDVAVIGISGVNADRDVAWFGGSTARFSIGLWMRVAMVDTSDLDAENTQFGVDETVAALLAGEVLQELHRDG